MRILGIDPGQRVGVATLVTEGKKAWLNLDQCFVLEYPAEAHRFEHYIDWADVVVVENFQIRTRSTGPEIHDTIKSQGVVEYICMENQRSLVKHEPYAKVFVQKRFPILWADLKRHLSGKHREDHWGDAALLAIRHAFDLGVRDFKIEGTYGTTNSRH